MCHGFDRERFAAVARIETSPLASTKSPATLSQGALDVGMRPKTAGRYQL